ncbi:G-type lectin S-receptor-like serine/threonine-protein kinase B120, partial [Dichanthelium oligosanthes]
LDTDKQRIRDRSKVIAHQDEELVWGIEVNNSEFKYFDYSQVSEATNNFSVENKLGQGGFGPVYKGRFPDGLEIAVKRLSSQSGQGFTEFRNEVQLVAKLQHRNLVRLLGCCFQGEEKMLVYEFLQNKSLDFFIFGITISTIIHICAWRLWKEQRWFELIDGSLAKGGCTPEMMRCINIALLCVQENATDRPTMSGVVAMLGSENMTLPEPKHPGYFHVRVAKEEAPTTAETYTINDATMSCTLGR